MVCQTNKCFVATADRSQPATFINFSMGGAFNVLGNVNIQNVSYVFANRDHRFTGFGNLWEISVLAIVFTQVYSLSRTTRFIFLAWVQETHCAVFYLRSLDTALACSATTSEGTQTQLNGRELCVRVPCSSRSVAWGQLFDPKEGPTVPRRLLGFLSDKNHGAWLVEKPGGDPRLDSPVRHGLLDFRQQSVAGAPGGCECVARRSVVQHGQNLIQLFPWHRDETFDIVEVIASVQYRVLSEEGNVT